MRPFLALVLAVLVLAGCSSATELEPPRPVATANSADAASPDAGAADPYAFACCSFSGEGLTEFDACCANWRAEHDGGGSL